MLKRFSCFISSEVFEEVVTRGKGGLYEDAFIIEKLVNANILKVMKADENEIAKDILQEREELGAGEKSTLHLFFSLRADAILSDDRTFLRVLKAKEIPFIVPSEIITRFVEIKAVSREEGLGYLNRLKPYITRENYLAAKRVITGGS